VDGVLNQQVSNRILDIQQSYDLYLGAMGETDGASGRTAADRARRR
jgi:hypothetical protein